MPFAADTYVVVVIRAQHFHLRCHTGSNELLYLRNPGVQPLESETAPFIGHSWHLLAS